MDARNNRREIRTLWVAIPVAFLAAFAAIFVVGPIASAQPGWLGMALHSACIALVWMAAGGHFAPRTHQSLGAVFVPGAILCAWLATAFVFGVSAYYGVATIVISCLAGACVWYWYTRSITPIASRAPAVVIPVATAIALSAALLMRPIVGTQRSMWTLDRERVAAHVATGTVDGFERLFVWTPTRDLRDSVLVHLELDPGSGDSRYALHRQPSNASQQAACAVFRARARALDSANVADGAVPRIVTALPRRQLSCDAGSFWLAIRVQGEQETSPSAPPSALIAPAPTRP